MKIIILYIIYFTLSIIFTGQVELSGWELILLFTTVLTAFFCGKALGESDKKEDKKETN